MIFKAPKEFSCYTCYVVCTNNLFRYLALRVAGGEPRSPSTMPNVVTDFKAWRWALIFRIDQPDESEEQ